jgi:hypothetical protein
VPTRWHCVSIRRCFLQEGPGIVWLRWGKLACPGTLMQLPGRAPASWAAIIFSGSMYVPIGFFANSGEFRRCSPDVQLSP